MLKLCLVVGLASGIVLSPGQGDSPPEKMDLIKWWKTSDKSFFPADYREEIIKYEEEMNKNIMEALKMIQLSLERGDGDAKRYSELYRSCLKSFCQTYHFIKRLGEEKELACKAKELELEAMRKLVAECSAARARMQQQLKQYRTTDATNQTITEQQPVKKEQPQDNSETKSELTSPVQSHVEIAPENLPTVNVESNGNRNDTNQQPQPEANLDYENRNGTTTQLPEQEANFDNENVNGTTTQLPEQEANFDNENVNGTQQPEQEGNLNNEDEVENELMTTQYNGTETNRNHRGRRSCFYRNV